MAECQAYPRDCHRVDRVYHPFTITSFLGVIPDFPGLVCIIYQKNKKKQKKKPAREVPVKQSRRTLSPCPPWPPYMPVFTKVAEIGMVGGMEFPYQRPCVTPRRASRFVSDLIPTRSSPRMSLRRQLRSPPFNLLRINYTLI